MPVTCKTVLIPYWSRQLEESWNGKNYISSADHDWQYGVQWRIWWKITDGVKHIAEARVWEYDRARDTFGWIKKEVFAFKNIFSRKLVPGGHAPAILKDTYYELHLETIDGEYTPEGRLTSSRDKL